MLRFIFIIIFFFVMTDEEHGEYTLTKIMYFIFVTWEKNAPRTLFLKTISRKNQI